MEEKKIYSFKEILEFLGYDYEFEKHKVYPFNRGRKNVTFSWGQILIPRTGIREVVQNKISDIKELPLKEINMVCQIPFKVENKVGTDFGMINHNISLTFRYDKEWKYGDVNKSIYETCFCILEQAAKLNDFFIIGSDYFHEFFSYYIIDNQYGLGAMTICSSPSEKYIKPKNPWREGCINCIHLDGGDTCLLEVSCNGREHFSYGPEYENSTKCIKSAEIKEKEK